MARALVAALAAGLAFVPIASASQDNPAIGVDSARNSDRDDILSSIDKAREHYQAEHFAGFVDEVARLNQLATALRLSTARRVLPQPLDGWEQVPQPQGRAMEARFNTVTSVSRAYHADAQNLIIEVSADNPAIAEMVSVYSSDAEVAAQNGAEILEVGSEKAVLKDNILRLGAGDWVVSISGNADREAMVAYGEAVDLQTLRDF